MSIRSPCIDVCQMSEDKTVCVGCYRSLSEIADWSRLTDAEKIRVIAAAQKRRATLECQGYSELIP
ncbi:MAG: DUF1289 domain-containing protein [Verrucomicrobia bacterium]|nr:MAG: DUF1289 domain-containing protein [Verrucomicrobiota bacterium]